jgi:hypothetical protein
VARHPAPYAPAGVGDGSDAVPGRRAWPQTSSCWPATIAGDGADRWAAGALRRRATLRMRRPVEGHLGGGTRTAARRAE